MAAENLGTLTVDLLANTGGFEQGMDRAQRTLKATTKEAAYQATQMEKLLGAIDPVTGSLNRLDKQQQQLDAHFKAGRLPLDEYKQFSATLNAQKDAAGNASTAFGKFDRQMAANGQTLKQYQNNLRNVPAQFTDIFVSLQGGQAPLTVLLQQGGQLKDMFGGIGPAAKALGGYVLGLVNPFTVAAGAAIALGVAYKQGSDEGTAYTTSLALTGNTAGTTAGQLGALAEEVAKSSGTVGKAAEVLAQLAASTRIPVESFEMIAEAAVKFESATGQAASETVKNFEKIARDPVKASLALNESLNYLTASTYNQIKAMQDQGDAAGAAALAEEAYATALTSRSDTIKSNLGTLETAWDTVKKAAKGAWDAALDVGREDTLDSKIALLRANLAEVTRLQEAGRSGRSARGGGNEEQMQQQLRDLTIEQEEKRRRATAQGYAKQAQQQSLQDQQTRDKIDEEVSTNAEKRAKKLEEYRALVARSAQDAIRTGNASLAISEEKQAAYIANLNEKYADKKAARTKAYVEDAGTKELDQAKQQYAVLQQQAKQLDEQTGKSVTLGAAQQELLRWEQQIADIKNKQTLTAAQKSLLATADQVTAQKTLNAELEKDTAARAASAVQAKQLADFQLTVSDNLTRFQQGLDNEVVGVGMGAEGRRRLQEDLALQQDYANQVERLRRDKIGGKITQDTYDKETAILKDALDTQLRATQDHYSRMDAARGEWSNGMSAALQDYVFEAGNIAGQSYDLFSNAFQGIEDVFVDAATTGKLSFKSFTDSVIADLARIAAKTLVVKPLIAALFSDNNSGVLSGLLGSATSGSGGGSSSTDQALGVLDAAGKSISVATSGFGQAVQAGYTAGEGLIGGIQGAFSSGTGYVSDAITSAFSSGSATAASVLAESTASNASYQLGGSLVSGEVGSATYATSAASSGISSANVVTAAISGFIQGYKANGIKGGVAAAGGAVGGMYAGAQAGSYFGPIGTAVGAVIGTIVGAAFGSSIFEGEWVTKDQGLQVGVDQGMLTAANYEYQKKKGGLFHSNKKRTNITALDPEMQKALDDSYDGTVGTVLGLFDALNVELNDGVLDGLNVASRQISTQGKTSDEIQTELVAFFTELGNAAVTAVDTALGGLGLGSYTVEGLTTFVNNLFTVNNVLANLNVGIFDISVSGGKMAEQLAAMAGGLEKFTEAGAAYYDKFFTDVEKADDVLKAVGVQFAGVGVALPATLQGFRDLVEALDITTDTGRALFTTLIGLSGNAAAAYDILEQRSAAYYQVMTSESERAADKLSDVTAQFAKMGIVLPKTMDDYKAMIYAASLAGDSGKELYEFLKSMASDAADAFAITAQQAAALRDAALSNASAAFSTLQRSITAQQKIAADAYQALTTSLNDMLATANARVSELTSIGSALDAALKSLNGTSDETVKILRAQAQATLANALATVRAGGSLAGFDGLTDALDVVSGNTTDLYSSLAEFNSDQNKTANVVAELEAINGKQLTSAEKTVATLEAQLDLAEKNYEAQQAQFQAQLDFAQAQLDAVNGVNTSILTVAAAITAMNAAIIATLATLPDTGAGSAAGSSPAANASVVDTLYSQYLGRTADAEGKAFWTNQLQSGGLTYDQIAQAFRATAAANGQLIPGRATGGIASGYTWVGENGPEIIATGRAQVYSAAQSKAIMSGSGSSATQELQMLREYLEAAVFQLTLNTAETAKNTKPLPQWNQNGLPATDPEAVF